MRIDGDQVRGAIGLISRSIDMKSTLGTVILVGGGCVVEGGLFLLVFVLTRQFLKR